MNDYNGIFLWLQGHNNRGEFVHERYNFLKGKDWNQMQKATRLYMIDFLKTVNVIARPKSNDDWLAARVQKQFHQFTAWMNKNHKPINQ